jgi:magnesium chelatase family protein
VAERVTTARERAIARSTPIHSRLSGDALLAACRLSSDALDTLTTVARARGFSGRAITRVLRVARTIADLDGTDTVDTAPLLEAVSLRAWDGP